MRAVADPAEALAAIRADDQRTIGLEDAIFILWINDEIGKIEWTPDHSLAAIAHLPRASSVTRAIERILWRNCFDECVDDVRIRRRNRHGNASPRLGRETLRARLIEIAPRRPAIRGLEHPPGARRRLAIAARAEGPSLAAEIPHSGIHGLRILRIHRHHRAAGRRI